MLSLVFVSSLLYGLLFFWGGLTFFSKRIKKEHIFIFLACCCCYCLCPAGAFFVCFVCNAAACVYLWL